MMHQALDQASALREKYTNFPNTWGFPVGDVWNLIHIFKAFFWI